MCYHCKVYLHLELSSLNRLPKPSCLIVMHKCEGPFCLFKEEIGECVHVRERIDLQVKGDQKRFIFTKFRQHSHAFVLQQFGCPTKCRVLLA